MSIFMNVEPEVVLNLIASTGNCYRFNFDECLDTEVVLNVSYVRYLMSMG